MLRMSEVTVHSKTLWGFHEVTYNQSQTGFQSPTMEKKPSISASRVFQKLTDKKAENTWMSVEQNTGVFKAEVP